MDDPQAKAKVLAVRTWMLVGLAVALALLLAWYVQPRGDDRGDDRGDVRGQQGEHARDEDGGGRHSPPALPGSAVDTPVAPLADVESHHELALAEVARHEIVGWVVRPDGSRGVPGALVQGTAAAGGESMAVTTSSDGRFALEILVRRPEPEVVNPAGYWVWAEHGSLVSPPTRIDLGAVEAEGRPVFLRLVEGGRLLGQVIDAEGKPLADAEIAVLEWPDRRVLPTRDQAAYNASVRWLRSDEDGRFSFVTRSGPKDVAARVADGPFGPVHSLTLDGGTVMDVGRIRAAGGAPLRIHLQCTGAGGQPLAGAHITIEGAGARAAAVPDAGSWHHGVSNGDGDWTSPLLSTSMLPLTLLVGAPAHVPSTVRIDAAPASEDGSVRASVRLEGGLSRRLVLRWPGGEPPGVLPQFELAPVDVPGMPQKGGRVTREPIEDRLGVARVEAVDASVQDSDAFDCTVSRPGDYRLKIYVPGLPAQSRIVRFGAETESEPIDVVMPEGREIRFVLALEPDEQALLGTVFAYDDSTSTLPLFAWAMGRERTTQRVWLPSGLSRLRFQRAPGLRGPWEVIDVEVPPRGPADVEVAVPVNALAPGAAGTLRCRVLVQDQAQVGVPIVVVASRLMRGAVLSRSGPVTLLLPAGTYVVSAQLSGLERVARDVEVRPGETTDLDLVLLEGP